MPNKYNRPNGTSPAGAPKWKPPKRTFGQPDLRMKTPDWPGLPGKASNLGWGNTDPKDKFNYPSKEGL